MARIASTCCIHDWSGGRVMDGVRNRSSNPKCLWVQPRFPLDVDMGKPRNTFPKPLIPRSRAMPLANAFACRLWRSLLSHSYRSPLLATARISLSITHHPRTVTPLLVVNPRAMLFPYFSSYVRIVSSVHNCATANDKRPTGFFHFTRQVVAKKPATCN